jgi:hypothetical protein
MFGRCPLYPQQQTSLGPVAMSALCQKQTYAVQQFGQFVVSPQNKTLLVLLAGRCCEPTVGSR